MQNRDRSFATPDRGLWLRILIPTFCSVALFVAAFAFIVLPQSRQSLLDEKKNAIRNETETAWSIINDFSNRYHRGEMSEDEAKRMAREVIRDMRYGEERKDYFWISDTRFTFVIHPYRPDLQGINLHDFTDPKGKHLLQEFVQATEKSDGAYVSYWWQWKDEPTHVVLKLSYVKRFRPWGWIVGTGLYLGDVEAEADRQVHNMTRATVGIVGLVCLLLAFAVWQGRKADSRLREQGQRYATLFEAANDGILILRGENIVSCNRTLADMLGHPTRDEMLGRTIWDISPEVQPGGRDSHEKGAELMARAYGGERLRFEWTHIRADGTPVDCEVSLARLYFADEPHLQAMLRDVTERKRAEERLRKSEERFRATFDQTFQLMGLLDPEGRVLYANRSALDFFGQELEHVLGRHLWELAWWSDDISAGRRVRKAVEQAATGVTVRYKTSQEAKDGDRRHFDFSIKPVLGPGGRVAYIIPEGRDITDIVRVEEEMRASRRYVRNLIDSLPSVLVGIDGQGLVEHWNSGAERVTGISSIRAQGEPLDKVLPQTAAHMEEIRRAMRERTPFEALRQPRLDEGRTLFEDLVVMPLAGEGEEGAVVRLDDVTSRVHMEEMMVQTEKMISVGGLAAGMAHEINNPLGIILQCVQSMERRLSPELPANTREAEPLGVDLTAVQDYLHVRDIDSYMTGIRDAGRRAAEIVANMLNFSRKSESLRANHRVDELLDRTVTLAANDYDLKKKYDFRQIEIVRDYAPDLPELNVTETEIEQVFLNLLKNAAQAMSLKEYVDERPQIRLSTARVGDFVEIRIHDNGPGMPPEVRRRVFEPFFTTKKPGVGTGLGLSVSYFIITENHGGEFEVQSAPGQGAEFIIRIPIDLEEKQPGPAA